MPADELYSLIQTVVLALGFLSLIAIFVYVGQKTPKD
jgi:hypothetical protein